MENFFSIKYDTKGLNATRVRWQRILIFGEKLNPNQRGEGYHVSVATSAMYTQMDRLASFQAVFVQRPWYRSHNFGHPPWLSARSFRVPYDSFEWASFCLIYRHWPTFVKEKKITCWSLFKSSLFVQDFPWNMWSQDSSQRCKRVGERKTCNERGREGPSLPCAGLKKRWSL